jgi:hypothetical protein
MRHRHDNSRTFQQKWHFEMSRWIGVYRFFPNSWRTREKSIDALTQIAPSIEQDCHKNLGTTAMIQVMRISDKSQEQSMDTGEMQTVAGNTMFALRQQYLPHQYCCLVIEA